VGWGFRVISVVAGEKRDSGDSNPNKAVPNEGWGHMSGKKKKTDKGCRVGEQTQGMCGGGGGERLCHFSIIQKEGEEI